MEISNLINLPSAGAKAEFAGKTAQKSDFEPKAPGAKAQAPPGPEPPPKAEVKPLGEEGAIREPNAPTQDLDFSPISPPKSTSGSEEVPPFQLEEALPFGNEGTRTSAASLPKDTIQGFVLASVAQMGPIVVPAVQPVQEPKAVTETSDQPLAPQENRTHPSLKWGAEEAILTPTDKGPSKLVEDICPASDPPYRGDKAQLESQIPDRNLHRHRPDQGPPQLEVDTTQAPNLAQREREFESSEKIAKIEVRSEPEGGNVTPPAVKLEEVAVKLKHADQPKPTGKSDLAEPLEEQRVEMTPKVVEPKSSEAKPIESKAPEVPAKNSGKRLEIDEDKKPDIIRKLKTADRPDLETSSAVKVKRSDPILETDLFVDAAPASRTPESPAPAVFNTSSKPLADLPSSTKAAPELLVSQRESVIRQVIDRVESLAATTRQNVTIHLDPKDFGSITLVVKRSGSEVDAEFYASHDAVRQALETNKTGLQLGLEQRGVQLHSMTVGSELANSSGRQEQASKEAAQQTQRHFAPRSERNEAPTYSLDAMRNLARRASGVDLWI